MAESPVDTHVLIAELRAEARPGGRNDFPDMRDLFLRAAAALSVLLEEREATVNPEFDHWYMRLRVRIVPSADREKLERLRGIYLVECAARVRAEEALSCALNDAADRWHETCSNEERGLAEWLGLTQEQYADYVMDWRTVIPVLAARESK